MKNPKTLAEQAKQAIEACQSLPDLDAIRVDLLGRKGQLTALLKQVSSIPSAERRDFGQAVNKAKRDVAGCIETKKVELETLALNAKLEEERIDVSLPGREQPVGSEHPISITIDRMTKILAYYGFEVAEGPEIEDTFHNFEALNMPASHPARDMHDTFYTQGDFLLRTHTSPVQIRAAKELGVPIRVIAPGRVYRRDSDLTHSPMFHQVEGLYIDEDVSFADLKAVLSEFLQSFFERDLDIRFRASYFPFTEPSAEVDIECVMCGGEGCRVCSHTGWLEVLGAGMVHPNVLKAMGVDREKYSGYAFGMGVERLAMLYYGVSDLRLFFENDVRFLRQFVR